MARLERWPRRRLAVPPVGFAAVDSKEIQRGVWDLATALEGELHAVPRGGRRPPPPGNRDGALPRRSALHCHVGRTAAIGVGVRGERMIAVCKRFACMSGSTGTADSRAPVLPVRVSLI